MTALKPAKITKVLIANRGEIAVRIIRAAKDSGIASVAIYADQDRDAMHTRMADESYSLNGTTSAETYLVIDKIIEIAKRSGANAVHPGYGFLAENASFAQACLDAGLIWIGPSPKAIDQLGDKVSARHIAEKVGAPLAPGTLNPVTGAEEVLDFVAKHGLPIAIKAAYGGGGRGIKVVYEKEEVADAFESATREAVAAFGRGECFVEKYLEKPRHVETQCLADSFGNVVVVSTRDCSLQRRHQKLVEEAPAPFLTDDQVKRLYESSKAILKEVGYQGAGTCEFLVAQDGTISFLEVNTRLQVEHPVSEEVTGLDLVREQFRIAEGGKLDYADPVIKGHSFEFRINGEDAGRNFMPAPGSVHVFNVPGGPGVRVDTGVEAGSEISGSFDSMIAKLIVTGATRVNDPAFIGSKGKFGIYTRWIETEWNNDVEPWEGSHTETHVETQRNNVVVEIDGKRIEVSLPKQLFQSGGGKSTAPAPKRKAHSNVQLDSGKALTSQMQATVVKIAVQEGDSVTKGQQLLVLEAMKMESPQNAVKDAVIKKIHVAVGATVPAGTMLIEFED
ncbi:MAG: ATP-grasp domain-containing protein [Micrococcales bacterium]|nr:ATP-grasp domain-containing protein [Micrococcales bacterium]